MRHEAVVGVASCCEHALWPAIVLQKLHQEHVRICPARVSSSALVSDLQFTCSLTSRRRRISKMIHAVSRSSVPARITDIASSANLDEQATISSCTAVGRVDTNARFTAPTLRAAATSAFARPPFSTPAETDNCASHSLASTRSERARAPCFVGGALSCSQHTASNRILQGQAQRGTTPRRERARQDPDCRLHRTLPRLLSVSYETLLLLTNQSRHD